MTVKEFLEVCDYPTILVYDLEDIEKSKDPNLPKMDKEILASAVFIRELGHSYCHSLACCSGSEIKKIKCCDCVELYI